MQNFIQPGNVVNLVAPYARNSGEGAKIGAIFGVASSTVANAVAGEFVLEGAFSLAKTSAQAWALGDRIYWDDTNKRCDNVPTVGMLIGTAISTAANPSSTGIVRLNGAASGMVAGPGADIVDVATANATDLATSEALANALKVALNSLLDTLRTSGVIQ